MNRMHKGLINNYTLPPRHHDSQNINKLLLFLLSSWPREFELGSTEIYEKAIQFFPLQANEKYEKILS